MGRLPFDPGKMRGGARAADEPLSVSALAGRIADALAAEFTGRVRVRGEVSDPRERTHLYFTLKDAASTISAVMWQSALRRAHHAPGHGEEVIASGRLEYYAPSGRLTFVVDSVEPVGEGELQRRFAALAEELRALGWFDPATKRALPDFPRRIAVVTSAASAALQDVIDTARRRFAGVELLVVSVRVQGDGAAQDVARALRRISRARATLGIDAVLVTRGGGSLEDLWAFNERVVAEAIRACAVPVVAAIGHETDTTIAELVADERAATPTQAAMRLIPDARALAAQVAAMARRAASDTRRALAHGGVSIHGRAAGLRASRAHALTGAARRIETLATRLERCRPAAQHARRAERLAATQQRMRRCAELLHERAVRRLGGATARVRAAAARSLERAAARGDLAAARLTAVGPQAVLERGFTCTFDGSGRVVRDPASVRAGDPLTTRTARGDIASRVESARAGPAWTIPPRRRRAAPADPSQMDLFAPGE